MEHLLRRGLVRREPAFRIASQSFASFVREAEPRARIEEWQRDDQAGAWQTIRLSLFLTLLIAGGFLAWTSREAFDATLALIPAAATAIPLILRSIDQARTRGT
jgi:hypothetical protein